MPRITTMHWKSVEKVFASLTDAFGLRFLAAGFRFARQRGSHRSYTKPGILRPVVIPTYDEVPVAIIRKNLQTAGISRDEYFRLLRIT